MIVVGGPEIRLQAARTLGADRRRSALDEDRVERVRELTNGRGADVTIEATGVPPRSRRACG